jgi:hypothetical protein
VESDRAPQKLQCVICDQLLQSSPRRRLQLATPLREHGQQKVGCASLLPDQPAAAIQVAVDHVILVPGSPVSRGANALSPERSG